MAAFTPRMLFHLKTYVWLMCLLLVIGVFYICSSSKVHIHNSVPSKLLPDSTKHRRADVLIPAAEDLEKLTFFPWKKDPSSSRCRAFSTKFDTTHSLPRMALVSYPGSGNTWIRQLIESSTGYFTGSVYLDKAIFSAGSYGEFSDLNCNCTVVQKTHDFSIGRLRLYAQRDEGLNKFHNNGILILRNPLKAIPSYRNYRTAGHTGLAPENLFEGEKWENEFRHSLLTWKELALTWINGINRGGVIFYERLIQEPQKELRRLINLTGLPLQEDRINCTLGHGAEKFHRQAKPQSKIKYGQNALLLAQLAIKSVQEALQRRNWPLLPVHLYEYLNE